MKMRIITILILGIGTLSFGQGTLTPPGAPAPTMKTLQQVEPRIDLATVLGDTGTQHKITTPGSYYLSENLVASNSIGIAIFASNVTLDLNGFSIIRSGNQAGSKAIYISTIRAITIKNGTITGFEDGIHANGSDGNFPNSGSRFEKLSISSCSRYGFFVGSESLITDCYFAECRGPSALFAGANSIVQNCTTKNSSGGYGFHLLAGAKISNCTAIDSGEYGFYVGSNSIFQTCSATLNKNAGFYLKERISVTGCTAFKNGAAGFQAESNCIFKVCSATSNKYDGFALDDNASVTGCNSIKNGEDGFFLGNYSIISGCKASRNKHNGIYARGYHSKIINCTTSKNEKNGILVFKSYSRISGCSANYNGQAGIYAFDMTSGTSHIIISDCMVNWNTTTGILINKLSSVLNCSCNANETGIHTVAGRNRIDGNTVRQNNCGIHVPWHDNLITRNSASENTSDNYDIDSDNHIGTIRSAPGTAGPWDNFEF